MLLVSLVLATGVALGTAAPAWAYQNPEAYDSLDTASKGNADWMSHIPDGTSLAHMSIPGTHDSLAVCGIQCDGSPWENQETQENKGPGRPTLMAQLGAGIRTFDIRVRVDHTNDRLTFDIHHSGTYQKANFDDVLKAFRDYLAQHKGETILLDLKAECDTGDAFQCHDADGFATDGWRKTVFGSYLEGVTYTGKNDTDTVPSAGYGDMFWAPSATAGSQHDPVPTMGDVRGKVVLLGFRGPQGGAYPEYGMKQLLSSGEYVQDDYPVGTISDIATKWETVRAQMRKINGVWDTTRGGEKEYGYQPDALYMNNTNGSSTGAYPYTVAGGTPTANGVNEFLYDCMDANRSDRCPEFFGGRDSIFGGKRTVTRTGIMLMDFPGGALIDSIIGINHAPLDH